jgi:prepilin-type N-terminal cleavage/methylation domain-containing protein
MGERGLTLIEVLVVVVIIGILAAIAIPKFSATRDKAYRSAMMSDLKNLATQQEINYDLGFTYSTDFVLLGFSSSEGVTVTVNEATNSGWSATATHVALPSNQCGLFHGNAAPAGGDPATVEGVITCDF